MAEKQLIVKPLHNAEYIPVWEDMRAFTDTRDAITQDEIWFIEHPPVYTLGQAGKREHILNPGNIPIIPVDRGGQVTYHGPGQLMMYVLLDLKRLNLSTRDLVRLLEQAVVNLLKNYGIEAIAKPDAPGVYVEDAKICSIGLRVRRNCSYHGLALNVAMDLTPFKGINPCGYSNLTMTQIADLGGPSDLERVAQDLLHELKLLL